MSGTAFGGEITRVTTTQELPLGFEVTVPDGDKGMQTWIYVFNDSGSWVVGSVIARDDSTVTYDGKLATASTPSPRVIGVAQHVIADGSYGFILRRGIGEVLAGTGTIDDDESICVDTTDAGTAMEFKSIAEAMDGTSTEHGVSGPFGWATEDADATATATCYINCQG